MEELGLLRRDPTPLPAREEWAELTLRQRQILDLLRAGKVNKEIANELGIGLGTVKQHVVALFKKLKVRNRAMAVSRGLDLPAAEGRERTPWLAGEGLLERRPCVVLSIVLPESAPEAAGRLLQQSLAAYAFDHDALFLARKGHAGDQIFGIQRASTHDLFLALRAAHAAFGALVAQDKTLVGTLQGGLTAGLAMASMNRHGGWSGEAIASGAIARARELAHGAKPGELLLDAPAQDLLRALSPCAPAAPLTALRFAALDWLPWRAGADEPAPVGRDEELARLDALLAPGAPARRLLCLEGETGMGKSRLCRHAAARALELGGRVHHYVCLPDGRGAQLYSLPYGIPTSLEAILAILEAPPLPRLEAVIVDDCQLLAPADLARLAQQAVRTEAKRVLLAGRRLPEAAGLGETLRLGRLAQSPTERLVVQATEAAEKPRDPTLLARSAAGVPLFAVELARHRGDEALPLTLRAVIGARLDGFGLDRLLLRQVARASAPVGVAELAKELDAPAGAVRLAAEQAVACGALRRDDRGRLSFAHPLLRQAVLQAQVE